MKKTKKETGIKFWSDWLKGDLLKREELVENLPIMKNIWKLDKIPMKLRKRTLTILLNSFFEDLENQIYLEDKA